jgi:hypothetical protein
MSPGKRAFRRKSRVKPALSSFESGEIGAPDRCNEAVRHVEPRYPQLLGATPPRSPPKTKRLEAPCTLRRRAKSQSRQGGLRQWAVPVSNQALYRFLVPPAGSGGTRRTVLILWPVPAGRGGEKWAVPVSNQRPPACKAGALPAELTARSESVSHPDGTPRSLWSRALRSQAALAISAAITPLDQRLCLFGFRADYSIAIACARNAEGWNAHDYEG